VTAAAGGPVVSFPGWHVWRSSHGRWWATRTGADARWGPDGIPMTVDADDAAGLTAQLAQYPSPVFADAADA
jgi:hypothetical protein